MFKTLKKIIASLVVLSSLLITVCANNTPIVSLPDGEGAIVMVSAEHQVFVTRDPTATRQRLYRFDGKLLLEAKKVLLGPDWIMLQEDSRLVGIYDYKGNELLPIGYEDISVVDDFTVLAKANGERWRVDLKTGKRTNLGAGSIYEAQMLPSGETVYPKAILDLHPTKSQTQEDIEGSYGLTVSYGTDAGGKGIAYFKNNDGQILLQTSVYGEEVRCRYGWYGRHIIVEDEWNGCRRERLYSGRGRLLATVNEPAASFDASDATIQSVIADGEYYIVWHQNKSGTESIYTVYDINGKAVYETSSSIDANQVGYTVENRRNTDDNHLIIVGDEAVYRLSSCSPAPSVWAEKETAEAVSLGVVDKDIQWWWRDSCTREEFCRMLVKSLEVMTGKTAKQLASAENMVQFMDCDNESVKICATLGIVEGYGNDLFKPGKFINRQEAAIMLARAAKYLGYKANGTAIVFSDESSFPSWAREAISFVSALQCGENHTPLMQGKSNNAFAPTDSYTVEQATATILRLTQFNR